MIFLAVGTWVRGFDRLVQAVDRLAGDDLTGHEVVAQFGNGSYTPKHMTAVKFCSPDDFVRYVSDSDFVISHAGIGTIAQVLRQNKAIVVLPRKPSLGEVSNDHQFATARQFESEGRILVAYEVEDLPEKLEEAKTFVPAPNEGGQGIVDAVRDFIDELAVKKRR